MPVPKITYSACDCLPADVTVAIIEGNQGVTVLLDANATVTELAPHITAVVRDHAARAWRHLGYPGGGWDGDGGDGPPRLRIAVGN